MRWTPGRRSGNLRDRRASSGGGGLPLPGKLGGGVGGLLVIIVALLIGVGGGDDGGGGSGTSGGALGEILEQLGGPTVPTATGDTVDESAPDPERRQVDFVSFVLDDVQGVWKEQFRRTGQEYQDATLELFRGRTSTGCGPGTSGTGPFYCPPDRGVYIDLGFFRELSDRFGAPGDFAQAYVIAHELGHHVQNLLGIDDRVREQSARDRAGANDLSIRQELQADCFAGVWGHAAYSRKLLESGDLEEGLAAAESVGDDRIQASAGAQVTPETWTHGSAQQRQTWFRRGFDSGDPERCDTFSGGI